MIPKFSNTGLDRAKRFLTMRATDVVIQDATHMPQVRFFRFHRVWLVFVDIGSTLKYADNQIDGQTAQKLSNSRCYHERAGIIAGIGLIGVLSAPRVLATGPQS